MASQFLKEKEDEIKHNDFPGEEFRTNRDTTVKNQRKDTIKEEVEQIEVLTTDIEKYTTNAVKLTKEIAEYDGDMSGAVCCTRPVQ